MNDNKTETSFIENGVVMSFDELGIFINNSLEELQRNSKSEFDFPKQEKTYDELIVLLKTKIIDDLNTPEIDKYLQYFREENSYYSVSNNRPLAK